MSKVVSLLAPVVATITPGAGAIAPGSAVIIDTNVAARVLYTLDGSIPTDGAFGTISADAPVTIRPAFSMTIKFMAIDLLRPTNYTKVISVAYVVVRNNPLEEFRDAKHFFRLLQVDIVDHNFFIGGEWTVPKSSVPYTFLFRNPESIPVRTRVLQNGRDTRTDGFPILGPDQAAEFPMLVRAAENSIEIQTEESISV
jgi:hypothetical protein